MSDTGNRPSEAVIALRHPEIRSKAEEDLLFDMASRMGLDPLGGGLYCTRKRKKNRDGTYDERFLVLSTIDGFRQVAEASDAYAGQEGPFWCGPDGEWRDVWTGSSSPFAAKIGVLRHGFAAPMWAVARFDSYSLDTQTWRGMPDVMIAKCAEALALRRAFPARLGGVYTGDEMAQASRDDGAPRRQSPEESRRPPRTAPAPEDDPGPVREHGDRERPPAPRDDGPGFDDAGEPKVGDLPVADARAALAEDERRQRAAHAARVAEEATTAHRWAHELAAFAVAAGRVSPEDFDGAWSVWCLANGSSYLNMTQGPKARTWSLIRKIAGAIDAALADDSVEWIAPWASGSEFLSDSKGMISDAPEDPVVNLHPVDALVRRATSEAFSG